MLMIEFSHKKGVCMQVSAITTSSQNIILNTRINTKGVENYAESSLAFDSNKSLSRLNEAKLFDNINEWKSFCQRQITDGKLDIIA